MVVGVPGQYKVQHEVYVHERYCRPCRDDVCVPGQQLDEGRVSSPRYAGEVTENTVSRWMAIGRDLDKSICKQLSSRNKVPQKWVLGNTYLVGLCADKTHRLAERYASVAIGLAFEKLDSVGEKAVSADDFAHSFIQPKSISKVGDRGYARILGRFAMRMRIGVRLRRIPIRMGMRIRTRMRIRFGIRISLRIRTKTTTTTSIHDIYICIYIHIIIIVSVMCNYKHNYRYNRHYK